MLRGGQIQDAKRQQVDRVRAKTGFLNKVFELRRALKRNHTPKCKENSHPDQPASLHPRSQTLVCSFNSIVPAIGVKFDLALSVRI
jgi:hypothetical protein